MLELLWQLGILSAVLVFGVKIGLAMGFANISKKTAIAIAIGYGAGIFILASLLTGYTNIVYKIFYEYNFVIFLLMSIVISYAGFHTIREWKVNHKNHAKASCAAMIAPCPCCFGAIVTATVIASPLIGVSTAAIGQYAAVFLSLIIVAIYFASGAIVKIVKKPYPVLMGNFMLFAGFYLLASVILLPNINNVIQSPMKPINMTSITPLIYVVAFVIILMVLGFYRTKRHLEG